MPASTVLPGVNVVEISDAFALARDEETCGMYALAYRKELSPLDTASAAAIGGLQNLPGAAINPLVPAAGALGGAGSAVVNWLDVLGANRMKVFWSCLRDKGRASSAYLVLEPQ